MPAPLRVADVELDEGAGKGLNLPGRRRLAGAKPDDRVPHPNRLARPQRDRPGDAVTLVEQPDHRDPLRHRSRAGRDRGHGLRDVDGPRLGGRLPVVLALLPAAVAAGEHGQDEKSGAEPEPHARSGVQAS